jgi:hypothetical protein
MAIISLEEALRLADADKFWSIRGKAIQAYANLEQALSGLFSALAGTNREIGSTIFFRIINSDARRKIIENLWRRKFDVQFNSFRNSLFSELQPIDRERNEIVHWNAACKAGHDGVNTTAQVVLTPANLIGGQKPPLTKTVDQIQTFMDKAIFFARLINMFTLIGCGTTPMSDSEKKPWLDIFGRKVIYPPPSDHPLSDKPPENQIHIQAFFIG